jgi:Ca2+-binding EF-hand superfamily protein
VEIAFSKFDSSGDDKLDYREFCEMINRKAEEDAARK